MYVALVCMIIVCEKSRLEDGPVSRCRVEPLTKALLRIREGLTRQRNRVARITRRVSSNSDLFLTSTYCVISAKAVIALTSRRLCAVLLYAKDATVGTAATPRHGYRQAVQGVSKPHSLHTL